MSDTLLVVLKLPLVALQLTIWCARGYADLFSHPKQRSRKRFGDHGSVPGTEAPRPCDRQMKRDDWNAAAARQRNRAGLGHQRRTAWAIRSKGDRQAFLQYPSRLQKCPGTTAAARASYRDIPELRNDSADVLSVEALARKYRDLLIAKRVRRREDRLVPEAENQRASVEVGRTTLLNVNRKAKRGADSRDREIA